MKPYNLFSAARLALLALGLSAALPVAALPIFFEATIDGAQANAGVGTGSLGTGSATMIFDDVSKIFSWDIQWSGLSGPVLVAHFHGPANPDQNAGVEIPIIGLNSPSVGNAVLTAAQETNLTAGQWYINLHTARFLGGEVRGQVVRSDAPVPVPSTMALMLLAALGFVVRRKQALRR